MVKPSYVRMEGTGSCNSRDPRKCFPFSPLREAEALLLSTAWFIYLDISGGLGTLSTVSEFSSVDHSFSVGSGLCWLAQTHLSAQNNLHSALEDSYVARCNSNSPVSRHSFMQILHFEKETTTNHNTLADWCLAMPGCVGVPLALRAPLIPQIPPGVHCQGQPAESSLSPLPVAHAGSGALICLPGTVPTVGGMGRSYCGDSPIVHPELHEVHFYR